MSATTTLFQKEHSMNSFLYADCPLIKVSAWNPLDQIRDDAVLISPRNIAYGIVQIPDAMIGRNPTIHTRSRRARVGMNARPSFKKSAVALGVSVSNGSWDYALVLHQGDTVTLATSDALKNIKPESTIALTAAGTVLRVNTHGLPRTRTGAPVFDPQDANASQHIEEVSFTSFIMEVYTSATLSVRERPLIPDGCIGFFESAISGLVHNTSTLDYPGSDGARVVELESRRKYPFRIEPGIVVATLKIYRVTSPLPEYRGTLGRSRSISKIPWAES